MKPGELKERRRRKAIERLRANAPLPRLTTTEALCVLDAACGAVKFHRLLRARGLASPRRIDKGYDFSLPESLGGGTYSIGHHSFHWTPKGVVFIAKVLEEQGIHCRIPEEISRWL